VKPLDRLAGVVEAGADVLLRQFRECRKEVRPVLLGEVAENPLDRDSGSANDGLAGRDSRINIDALMVPLHALVLRSVGPPAAIGSVRSAA
jgi:hypothetical protein